MNLEISEDTLLAVKRGSYWLDENYPGWENSLNLKDLRMNSCNTCVIGQAVGGYYDTVAIASGSDKYSDDSHEWAVDHGFDSYNPRCYGELEQGWTEVVTDRLG